VIGAGAAVTGAGVVRGSVIWPGARAEAPLDGVVVTTGGAVVRAA
jgi:mannose-1-phosphate guanylyltransferase